jgi:hypothetical protein
LMTPTPANTTMSGHCSCGVFALRRVSSPAKASTGRCESQSYAIGGAPEAHFFGYDVSTD